MRKALIPTKLDSVAAELLKKAGFQVVQDAKQSIDELAKANPDACVLIVRSEKVTAEVIDAIPALKLVVRAGAGYNTIDTKHARRHGVDVMNTPGANANGVAEEVVAMMLAAYRHVVAADASTRRGEWEKSKFMGHELTGKTLGVLGLGNIGRLLVKRLSGFEMTVLGYDPVMSADLAEKIGVKLCGVEEIFAKADCISLHIPENDETKGMVNRALLEKMKPGAMLVNCARSGIVNEEDLRAVKKERDFIYCNDVYPKDAEGKKSIEDVADLMLPHLGASTVEANFTAARRSAEQSVDYFEKGISSFVVNKGVPDGLDESYQRLASLLARLARAYLGKDTQPHQIETSFYGKLNQFADWMLAPICSGLCPEFDPFMDASDAKAFLKSRGIMVVNREIDDSKHYGEAMTIDLFEGGNTIRKVSLRGTIAEGNLMVSRLNNFDKLYLEPSGNNLFVEYADQPGVIAKISKVLGELGINIIDIRAPQDVERKNALSVVKTSQSVGADTLAQIKKLVDAKVAFTFNY